MRARRVSWVAAVALAWAPVTVAAAASLARMLLGGPRDPPVPITRALTAGVPKPDGR